MALLHFLLRALPVLVLGSLPLARAETPATNAPPATTPAPASTPSPSAQALSEAFELLNHGDQDGALNKIDASMSLDAKNVRAYLLRGSIYGQKRLWARAQRDYETALELSPKMAMIKFNLAELKFMQRLYDAARPGFASVQDDPEIGDLAAYKVFLCDLMTRHNDAAAKELDAFNKVGGNPSYYYANAAWCMAHSQPEEARSWLTSASRIYSPTKNALYIASLTDLTRIHAPTVSFVTRNGKKYDKVQASLDDDTLHVLTSEGWIAISMDQLPDDLRSFPADWQNQIATRRAPTTDAGTPIPTLTTRQGQKYNQVSVFVENTGLRVKTATGFVSIPFEQLPDDLSIFPPDLQKQIAAKRPAPESILGVKVPSVTTRQGQKYDNVEVIVEEVDIRVKTATGWISILFEQLPDDLSAFPPDLQRQIAARRTPVSDAATGIPVPTLITKQGQTYTNVGVFVEGNGLRVKTATGFVNIPFEQLPDDLSSLPNDLQKQISAKRRPSVDVTSGIKVPSLVTKQGEKYDNVEVFVEGSGLRVKTSTGFVNIPFEQLPADLSSLPVDLRRQIAAKKKPVVPVNPPAK